MIKVTHEKQVTETEVLKLISLDTYFLGYPLYIRVPENMTEDEATILERQATKRFVRLIEKDMAFI